jgi:peptidoglycan/LPS O-acetylase OafA/YrhL
MGLQRSDTIASVLDRHRGIGPGFDWLRIGLSLLIFYCHAKYIAGKVQQPLAAPAEIVARATKAVGGHSAPVEILMAEGGWSGWHRPFAVALVPMFFALSGFLVTGSAIRLKRTSTFLAFRALRIVPALGSGRHLQSLHCRIISAIRPCGANSPISPASSAIACRAFS